MLQDQRVRVSGFGVMHVLRPSEPRQCSRPGRVIGKLRNHLLTSPSSISALPPLALGENASAVRGILQPGWGGGGCFRLSRRTRSQGEADKRADRRRVAKFLPGYFG